MSAVVLCFKICIYNALYEWAYDDTYRPLLLVTKLSWGSSRNYSKVEFAMLRIDSNFFNDGLVPSWNRAIAYARLKPYASEWGRVQCSGVRRSVTGTLKPMSGECSVSSTD
jgi:hypothetical protein